MLEANPTFCEITGFNRDELLGRVPPLLLGGSAPDGGSSPSDTMRERLADEGMWRGEVVHQRPDGAFCTLQLTVSAVRGHDGAVRSHVVAVSDITQSRQQQERLERQAYYDELTRLPNRMKLAQLLEGALETSQREGSLLTVCHLDIDHFKAVNERHGHCDRRPAAGLPGRAHPGLAALLGRRRRRGRARRRRRVRAAAAHRHAA